MLPGLHDMQPLQELEQLAKEKGIEIFKISAVTGEGMKELFLRVSEVLKTLPKEEITEADEKVIYTLEEDKEPFDIKHENGEYVVSGPAIERLMGRVNMEDNESMYYFQKMLQSLGVDDKLKEMGVKAGDTVRFIDYELEWYE